MKATTADLLEKEISSLARLPTTKDFRRPVTTSSFRQKPMVFTTGSYTHKVTSTRTAQKRYIKRESKWGSTYCKPGVLKPRRRDQENLRSAVTAITNKKPKQRTEREIKFLELYDYMDRKFEFGVVYPPIVGGLLYLHIIRNDAEFDRQARLARGHIDRYTAQWPQED